MGKVMDKKELKTILDLKESKELSDAQTLYIIALKLDTSIYIDPKEFLELIDEEILTDEGFLNIVFNSSSSKALNIKPIFESNKTKGIYLYLKSAIAYKDIKTGLAIPVNIEHSPDRVDKYFNRISTLIKQSKTFYNPYSVFLALFPTMLLEDNKKWVTFFKSKYSGMELRKKTVTNAKRFYTNSKDVDMGVFLYGVYLFINNGIINNETYIGGQKTFFEEWQDWYDKAKMVIDKFEGNDYKKLFRSKNRTNFKGGVSL